MLLYNFQLIQLHYISFASKKLYFKFASCNSSSTFLVQQIVVINTSRVVRGAQWRSLQKEVSQYISWRRKRGVKIIFGKCISTFFTQDKFEFFVNKYSKAFSFQKDFHFMKQSEGILRSYEISLTCFCNRGHLVALYL